MRPFKSERLRAELRLSTRFLHCNLSRSVALFNRSLKDQVLVKAYLPNAVNADFNQTAHVAQPEIAEASVNGLTEDNSFASI
jgi:hypothetical protein